MINEPIPPIRYMSLNLGPIVGANDALMGVRVVPTGRNGNTVLGKTLNYGEPDSGDAIVILPGEKLFFPPGSLKLTIQDIDRQNILEPDGYAALSNTVWTWLQPPGPPDPALFRFLFAAARRIDTAHDLCVSALQELGELPDEPFIKTRARLFKALGYAELMCVALNRATKMITDIPSKFSVAVVVPNTADAIFPALTAMRNAIEHIEDRAFGNVFGKSHPDALTIFDQDHFFSFGVLRYAGHSLDLRADIVPALISSRQFIFEVAVKKAGAARTNNVPLEFFGNDNRSLDSESYNSPIQDLSKATEADLNVANAYLSSGTAYIGKGDFDLAIRDLNKAIELDPTFVNAYYIRGTAHLGKGDVDLAIRDYGKAIELNPNFGNAFCNRGIAYGGKGEYELAIRDLSKALELDPNLTNAYFSRGAAYLGQSDFDSAIRDLDRAIELNPLQSRIILP